MAIVAMDIPARGCFGCAGGCGGVGEVPQEMVTEQLTEQDLVADVAIHGIRELLRLGPVGGLLDGGCTGPRLSEWVQRRILLHTVLLLEAISRRHGLMRHSREVLCSPDQLADALAHGAVEVVVDGLRSCCCRHVSFALQVRLASGRMHACRAQGAVPGVGAVEMQFLRRAVEFGRAGNAVERVAKLVRRGASRLWGDGVLLGGVVVVVGMVGRLRGCGAGGVLEALVSERLEVRLAGEVGGLVEYGHLFVADGAVP